MKTVSQKIPAVNDTLAIALIKRVLSSAPLRIERISDGHSCPPLYLVTGKHNICYIYACGVSTKNRPIRVCKITYRQ